MKRVVLVVVLLFAMAGFSFAQISDKAQPASPAKTEKASTEETNWEQKYWQAVAEVEKWKIFASQLQIQLSNIVGTEANKKAKEVTDGKD